MSNEVTLNVRKFLVCSTGEDVLVPDPNDLDTALQMCEQCNSADEYEEWDVFALIERS
jgi:hypothetical protein